SKAAVRLTQFVIPGPRARVSPVFFSAATTWIGACKRCRGKEAIPMRLGRTLDAERSAKEQAEHLSDDALWAMVKSKQSLPDAYVQHVKDCRDCREFVREFSIEARDAGFRFPDVLPQSDQSQKTSVSPRGIARAKSA